jgi:hypothetical protein
MRCEVVTWHFNGGSTRPALRAVFDRARRQGLNLAAEVSCGEMHNSPPNARRGVGKAGCSG